MASSQGAGETSVSESDLEMLRDVMAEKYNKKRAREMLIQHKGDLNKVIEEWIALAVDAPSDQDSIPELVEIAETDNVLKAAQPSTTNQVRFGPSEREPAGNWSMVTTANQADTDYERAMRESLNDLTSSAPDEAQPEKIAREDGRPVIIWTVQSTYAYIDPILQALFNIPQVRIALSSLADNNFDPSGHANEKVQAFHKLVEMATFLDKAPVSVLIDDMIAPGLANLLNTTETDFRRLSPQILSTFSSIIEDFAKEKGISSEYAGLFNIVSGSIKMFEGNTETVIASDQQHSFNRHVEVNISTLPDVGRDLIGKLSHALINPGREPGSVMYDVIEQPPEVVVFNLDNMSGMKTDFSFPATVYLDQFMAENTPLVHKLSQRQRDLQKEAESYLQKKKTISNFKERDNLRQLEATIHYYDTAANDNGDARRRETLTRVSAKLKTCLEELRKEIKDLDEKYTAIQTELAGIFNVPELQRHPYDLRAVLMNDGLRGRKNSWCCVHDQQSRWWKIAADEVTQTNEDDVLNDTTGVHLAAGPYMLFYSKRMPESEIQAPLEWPKIFMDALNEEQENQEKHSPKVIDHQAQRKPEVHSDIHGID